MKHWNKPWKYNQGTVDSYLQGPKEVKDRKNGLKKSGVDSPLFFYNFFLQNHFLDQKTDQKYFKKWYLGSFLTILKIIIHLDMIFMIF